MGDTNSPAPSQADSKSAVSAATTAPRPALQSASSNPSTAGTLYKQKSGSNVVLVRRLKRKDDGTLKSSARWFVENQIGLSFNLLALLFLAHLFIPKARAHTHKFFQLSYFNPDSGKYATGSDDVFIVMFCIVLFTGLRAATMEYLFEPLAKLNGISKRKDMTRFAEQAWTIVYYTIFWSLGLYIYCNSPHYLNMRELWTEWPNREMNGMMKGYMLIQWAFYLQLMIVINIEDRRKDHWQMFSHHVITAGLIWACYSYNHTRVGNLILVLMDNGDILLPLAKCLKYCGFSTVCDVLFGIFMVSWVLCRHIGFNLVCWSVYAHTPHIMETGCFQGSDKNRTGPFDTPPGLGWLVEPFFSSTGTVCYNETLKWAFLTPLLVLQAITIVWFAMILRVAIRVISGTGAEDTRSDDEEVDGEQEDEFVYEEAQPLEEEVGVEQLDLKGWERRSGVKRQANSSGVSLPGHSDRKELLGRIGCEKQVD
jgi:acyl-CoA-dependent ceramide synthase